MVKLIATDMDGTFLDSNKKFDKAFIPLFYRMKEMDIKFVLASGNQYYRLYQKFLPMSEDMYFVAENGSVIAEGVNILECKVIKKEYVKLIRDLLENNNRIMMILCGKKGAYALNKNIEYKHEVQKYYCSYFFVDSFDEVDDDIMKIALLDTHANVSELYKEIENHIPSELRIVTSGNEWIDVQNKDGHKGVGLAYLQELYGISKDECMAFGDQMNDYEMLEQVKYGYAMSNAVEPIKDIAYEVIGSNDEQAVIKKIKEVLDNNGNV